MWEREENDKRASGYSGFRSAQMAWQKLFNVMFFYLIGHLGTMRFWYEVTSVPVFVQILNT